MLKKIIIFLLCVVFLNAQDGVKKVVIDLTAGDMKTIERKLLSGIAKYKAHYESNLEELEVSVVIHGDAYKYFINDLKSSPYKNDVELILKQKDIKPRLKSMSNIYEVEFLMCKSGMKKLKINENNLYKFVKLVPTSSIGLIDKQNEDFAYLPIR